jgi:hypothetical protein
MYAICICHPRFSRLALKKSAVACGLYGEPWKQNSRRKLSRLKVEALFVHSTGKNYNLTIALSKCSYNCVRYIES